MPHIGSSADINIRHQVCPRTFVSRIALLPLTRGEHNAASAHRRAAVVRASKRRSSSTAGVARCSPVCSSQPQRSRGCGAAEAGLAASATLAGCDTVQGRPA